MPNVLYDPNYRQFDVEGYRIYRGRVDDPAALELVAQFDYSGTTMSDYGGYVNPNQFCAPELGVVSACAAAFDSMVPGIARTAHVDVDIGWQFVQTRLGDRTTLPNGLVTVLHADTVGGAAGYLQNTGVPFSWRDTTVRQGFRYFYTVTAFDVNSLQSGPPSQESPRVLKAVRPESRAGNLVAEGRLTATHLIGRGVVLDTATIAGAQPDTIEPATGRFKHPFPPASSWGLSFYAYVPALLDSGSVRLTLDSATLGSPYDGIPHVYWWTSRSGGATTHFSLPVLQHQETGVVYASVQANAVPVAPALAGQYGGDAGYRLPVNLSQGLPGADYAGLYGRGCVNGRPGFLNGYQYGECAYNGSRWFDGPSPAKNETKVHPIEGNQANFTGTPVTNYNNAGELSGVVTIHNTQAYQSVGGAEYRPVEGIKAGAHRAADFNVYWGSGGRVDSVIDITHNVPVPFSPDMGLSWGILNGPAASLPGSYDQRLDLTGTDMGCVEPLRSYGTTISCGSGGPRYQLANVAVPSSIAFFSPVLIDARTAPVAPNAGIVFYLAGDFFTMELAGGQVPAKGTVWSLRQYIGAITGGSGDGGNYGSYAYSNPESTLPLTAAGVEIELTWSGVNALRAPMKSDLASVHPVPDPYMFGNAWTNDQALPVIRFVNLPADAIIRIYTSSGVLVRLLEHHSTTFGGSEDWDVRTRSGRKVASGVYFFHVESGDARRTGRMTIVNPDGGR